MQLYELEKRLTMNVKFIAKLHNIDTSRLYVNVQTSKGAYGHYSVNRWQKGEKEMVDELALNPEHFKNPLEVLDTIVHELVHVYCKQNNIKDTSRNGYYHNQRFKKAAEDFGLLCIATDSGWNTTAEGNEEKLSGLMKQLPYEITSDMIRRGDGKKRSTTRTPSVKHEYCCPKCNKVIKSKELVYMFCMECREPLAIESTDPMALEWLANLKGMMGIA